MKKVQQSGLGIMSLVVIPGLIAALLLLSPLAGAKGQTALQPNVWVPPMPVSADPHYLTPMNGWLYFNARRDDFGTELWRTDGTTTEIVADIWTGPDGSYPSNLVAIGDSLYFMANDGSHGRQLWRTNGTQAGTTRLTNLNAAYEIDIVSGPPPVFKGHIYLSSQISNEILSNWRVQIWRYNLETNQMSQFIEFSGYGYVVDFKVVNDNLHFVLEHKPVGQAELWKTDGSAIFMVGDPIRGSSAEYQNSYYYASRLSSGSCAGPLSVVENWTSATVTGTIPGRSGTKTIEKFSPIGVIDGTLIFTGELRSPGVACNGNTYLHKLTGTAISQLYSVDEASTSFRFTASTGVALGEFLYFSGDYASGYETYDIELWRTNGALTERVSNIHLTNSSNPYGFIPFGTWLYFGASDGSSGYELWRTNGTNTNLVKNIDTRSIAAGGGDGSGPGEFTLLGEWMYFSADDYVHGRELWRTNGTTTELVKDIAFDKLNQEISFSAVPNRTTAQSMTFSVVATASSGLAVTMSASGACTVDGFIVTVTAGSCTLTASQSGNGEYEAAPDVGQTFVTAKQSQSIVFEVLPNRTIGQALAFEVATSATSGLPVQLSAIGSCTVSGSLVTVTVGTCTLTASQVGNGFFLAASSVTRSFATTKLSQAIVFGALSGRTVLAAPATLAAAASSGLTVAFASETPDTCSISGATLSIVDIGTCTVTATQSGDSVYLAALPVSRSFVITRVLLTNKTVRFTEPDGTTPIVGATVTWSSRDGAYQSTSAATTNSSGNIVFKSIPGGTIDFAVNGIVIGAWSGYQEVSGFVGSAASTVRLSGNSYSYFTTTLTVQMPDGSPVVGAEVVLWRGHVSGSLEARFCRPFGRVEWVLRDCKSQGVTDASGRVTFRIIPTTLNTDCCGEGKRTWAQVAISDTSISYTTEAEVFDNVATAVIEIEQLPVVDMLAVDALVGYAVPRTITAVARDSSGDPMAGQALTLSASVSGASASCSGKKTTATTGSTGIATFKVCPVKTAVWSVDGASIVGSSGVTLTVQSTPTAPRSLTSTGKTRAVALTWTAPASVNIGTVTDYIVQYRLQGSSTWITFRDGTSTARKATVTGLVKGRVYEFRIAAKNKAGTGTWSATVLRAAE